MATFRSSDVIRGSIEEVFAVVNDMEGRAEWDPQTLRVEKLSEGPVGEGTRFEMVVKGPGKMSLEVVEFDEPSRITFQASMKMGEGRHTFNISPTEGGTVVDQVLETRAKGLGILFAPLMGMMAKRSLKQIINVMAARIRSQAVS